MTGSDPYPSNLDDRELYRTAKGGGVLIAGRLFNYICRIAITVLLARLLGADNYGLYNLAISAATIAGAVAMFGLDTTVMRFIAIMNSRRDDRGLWGALQVGIGTSLLLSLTAGVVLFALAYPIATYVFHEPILAPLLQLSSLVVPFLTLSDVLAGATRGFKNMKDTVVAQNLVQPLVRLILIVAFALLGLSVPQAILAFGFADLCASILLVYYLNKHFGLKRSLASAQRNPKEILGFSFSLWIADLLVTFQGNIQTLLLGSLNTIRGVGLYSIANQVNLLSHIFHTSITQSARPLVAELHDQGKRLQLGHLYQTSTRWAVTLNLPFIIIIALFPTQIVSIFGKDFADAAPALIIMALANFVSIATGMCGAIIEMTGHTRLRLLNSAVRVVLAISLNFLLIPRWGVIGAAVAVLVQQIIGNLLPLIQIWILYRIIPYNRSFFKPLAAGLIAIAAAAALRLAIPLQENLAIAVFHVLVVLSVYAAVMLFLGLSKEERSMVAQIRRRVGFLISRQ